MKKFLLVLSVLLMGAVALAAQALTIYCEDDPPNQFANADKSLSGYVVDLVKEMQKRVGNNDPILMVPWARGYDAIQTQPNVVLFSMTRTADRNPLFGWIGPTKETQYGFFVKADSKIVIRSMDDAKKLSHIGVYRNDVRDTTLTKAGFTNLDRADDNITNIKKLMVGRIDAITSSPDSLPDEMKAAGYKAEDVKLAYIFLKPQLYVATSKTMPAGMVKAWNDALDAMKKDGTFKTILAKYYPGVAMPGPAITTFN